MKKIVLFLVLSAIGFAQCPGQNKAPPSEPLKKYSYNIAGFQMSAKGVSMAVGTGFFYRSGGKIFFITAKHVLSKCTNEGGEKPLPEDMIIFITNDTGYIISTYPIKSKPIADTINCMTVRDNPDLILIELDVKRLPNVRTIESFHIPPFEEVDQVKIFGFPYYSMTKGQFHLEKASSLIIDFKKEQLGTGAIIDNKIDSLNFVLTIDTIYENLEGYSGSPVFVKRKGKNQWRLLGILIGAYSDKASNKQHLLFCKESYIRKEIRRRAN